MKISSVSFTSKGDKLNRKLKDIFGKNILCFGKTFNMREENIYEWTKAHFKNDLIIFIGAAGIAVRAISKCISSKDEDCAVICIDELGRFVIPLLSGHIGKANEYASFLADKLGAVPVITTATDINKVFAFDIFALENNMEIEDIKFIKNISSALLEGEKIGLKSYFETINIPKNVCIGNSFKNGVCISPYVEKPFENTLNLVPKCVFIGIGCRKNAPYEDIKNLFEHIIQKYSISRKSIRGAGSIDIKKDEKGLKLFCDDMSFPLETFSAEELNDVEGDFNKSEFVKKITGTDNVCERSALKLSKGNIIVPKTAHNGVTMAFAAEKRRINFEHNSYGHRLQDK